MVTGILERSAIPPEDDVNDKVEGSEEDEGTASHDQDERERPQILVQWNEPFVLLTLT